MTEENREAATGKKASVPPQLAEKLFRGEINLAQLVGMSPQMQYQVAGLAHQLVQTGRLDRALVIYRGLVAVSPLDSVFHARLGSTLAALNQLDAALESFKRAIELNHQSIDALTARGELYLRANQITQGIEDLIAAVDADPKGKHVASLRARAILMMLKETADRQRGIQRPKTNPTAAALPAAAPRARPSSEKAAMFGDPVPKARPAPQKVSGSDFEASSPGTKRPPAKPTGPKPAVKK